MTHGAWSDDCLSWGRTPGARQFVVSSNDAGGLMTSAPQELSVLARGLGRSYGDVCVNAGNALMSTPLLDHFIDWDPATGVLRAEAGTSLRAIAELTVPHGWFLPVTPGTEFVSLGGAVANDIHGKNHHRRGTFGASVTELELLRSDGSRLRCSRAENAELFRATIGGLGLTGLMTWVALRLIPISGPWIEADASRFATLEEFVEINRESEAAFEYTVAWVDCLDARGRGRYMRGNHSARPNVAPADGQRRSLSIPFPCPAGTLNRAVVKVFNEAYYRQPATKGDVPFRNFFYPLDVVANWPQLYGRHGFFQYQCVTPFDAGIGVIKQILAAVARAGEHPTLAVLKTFGTHEPEGMLSFPRPGFTLALDLANRGDTTRALLERLDAMVAQAGGAIYPAKDARMGARMFKASFPRWQEFSRFIDPRFSSSLWRRVTA